MKKTIIVVSLLLFINANALADTLYLKSGAQYVGAVLKQDDEKLIFRVGEGQDSVDVTFFNEEVLRIDKAQVSSFITLPFGNGQQVDIPRPIFKQSPVITDQVQTQKKQRPKVEEDQEEAQLQTSSQPTAQVEGLGEKSVLKDASESAQLPAKDKSSEVKEQAENVNLETAPSSTSQVDLFKGRGITEELSRLLDQKEKEYFIKINSMVQGVTVKMASLISNPGSLAKDPSALNAMVQDLSGEIDSIIAQLGKSEIPSLFINFHSQYLDNLSLMKAILGDMSKGDIASAQIKTQELQKFSANLQNELSKILEIKQGKQQPWAQNAI